MPRLCVQDITEGDVVLVECEFVREFAEDVNQWSVHFQLCAISLLHAPPRLPLDTHDSGFQGEM